MDHSYISLYVLLVFGLLSQTTNCKKVSSMATNSIPMMEINRQDVMPINSVSSLESNPTIRASSFMVDPLIIIALIALPTIGMLGLSSLIMPLIPIGIYLIQQFFPASTGRRRRRSVDETQSNRLNALATNFERMMRRFNSKFNAFN